VRVLITGAAGNIGKGVIPKLLAKGYELVLSDLNPLPPALHALGLPFHSVDVRSGDGLEVAAEGCDLILHTPAWHGIHWDTKTEIDYWRLNVDGLFWAYQAARAHGIKRFLFLSSMSWLHQYDKYGFTKRIGEELCEYHRVQNGISYVSIRPGDLTPWSSWVHGYGPRLLYWGVDREDVLRSVVLSVEYLARPRADPESATVTVCHASPYTEGELEDWEIDPIAACERIFPGSKRLVEKYQIDISAKPLIWDFGEGAKRIGFAPEVHFGTFLAALSRKDIDGSVDSVQCDY
jgi:hypothetical protein